MNGFSTNLLVIRPAEPDDKNFIYETWLLGLYHGNRYFKLIDKETYFQNYQLIVSYLLGKKEVSIRVAALREDPSVIIAYAIVEGETLHYLFTKKHWRKLGIATWLVPPTIKVVTHLTEVGKSLKPKEVKYNPFIT